MLYHLFDWLNSEGIKFPGSRLFEFITFRLLLAVLLSLFITTFYGKKLIKFLQKKQIGESIRNEGLPGEEKKVGTPTMGGIIIILAIIIPTLLLANLTKVYVQLMLISTVWLGIIGFIDDYLKLKGKRDAQQKGQKYAKGGIVVNGVLVSVKYFVLPLTSLEKTEVSVGGTLPTYSLQIFTSLLK